MSTDAAHPVPLTPAEQDRAWMLEALAEAVRAEAAGEVPVGAVLILNGHILGRGANAPIAANDPTAHAEIRALRQAAAHLRNYRLTETTLYTSVEPCLMCMGALLHARVKRLVFGCFDSKAGAAGSVYDIPHGPRLTHRMEVTGGVCEQECRSLVQRFFQTRRLARKPQP